MIQNQHFHSFLEEPWEKSFLHLMRPTVMGDLIDNQQISFSKALPGFLKKHWKWIDGNTLVDPFRMGTLIDLFVKVKDLPGEVLECGSYKGGTGILLGLLIKEFDLDKKVQLFDSFMGLPDPNKTYDKGYRKGQFKSDYDNLQQLVIEAGLENIVFLNQGWFSDSIPVFLEKNPNLRISFLHIDCDLYDSTKDCYPLLDQRVVDQGIVVLDDFNDGGRGEKMAVLETFNKNHHIHIGPAPQAYVIKSTPENDSQHLVVDSGVTYNLDRLMDNEDYLQWMQKELKYDYKNKLLNTKNS